MDIYGKKHKAKIKQERRFSTLNAINIKSQPRAVNVVDNLLFCLLQVSVI